MLVLFLGDLSSTQLLLMAPPFCDPSTLMDFLESVFIFSWTLQHLSNFHLINDPLKDIFQQGSRFLPPEFSLWSSVTALSFSKIEVFFFHRMQCLALTQQGSFQKLTPILVPTKCPGVSFYTVHWLYLSGLSVFTVFQIALAGRWRNSLAVESPCCFSVASPTWWLTPPWNSGLRRPDTFFWTHRPCTQVRHIHTYRQALKHIK